MRPPLSCSLALLCLAVQAQTAVHPPLPMDIQVERDRIQAERIRETTRFDRQQRDCYARFAVNDCLAANRAQRRVVLDDLRRQDLSLDALERRNRSLDQLERIRDKTMSQPDSLVGP